MRHCADGIGCGHRTRRYKAAVAKQFLSLNDFVTHGFDTVIDVRSPAEFAEDHMPNAVSLPVLSNEERSLVGTIYKQESPFKARKIGAALVARNAARHIEETLADFDGGWRPLVYCWRGGQRSGSFASILSEIGWRAETVKGGYRSYRRLVATSLYETSFAGRVVLLDGNTGTGKTEVLARLKSQGFQTLDLEDLARHRGSVLGSGGAQPSQKGFESQIAGALARLDLQRPVVIEAESSKIGRLLVPPALFEAMRDAPRIELRAPLDARAVFLAQTYGSAKDELADSVLRLRILRGAAKVEGWARLIREGALEDAARALMTEHYDPSYAKSRSKAAAYPKIVVTAETLDDAGLIDLTSDVAKAIRSLG